MILKKNFFFSKGSLIFLLILSLVYAILVSTGYYGFNHDFIVEYSKNNYATGGTFDLLGFRIATLTIDGQHIGVAVASFFLALASGLYFRSLFEFKKLYSLSFFLFIYILALHTHPIIMSTSGAMRQGLTMVCVFLFLTSIMHKRLILGLFFLVTGSFTHKSGLIFLFIYLFTALTMWLYDNKKNIKNRQLAFFLSGVFVFVMANIALGLFGNTAAYHRVVYGDFRTLWLIINLFYIAFYIWRANVQPEKNFSLFIYFFNFLAPAFLISGLNWQYERINMIMLFPIMFDLIFSFSKKESYCLLTIAMLLLFFLTIYQGMFSFGLIPISNGLAFN